MEDFTLLSLVFALCGLYYFCLRSLQRRSLPPGPFAWPIVGCLLSMRQPLHCHLANLSRKYGPLVCLQLGMARPTVAANNVEMAKQVLKVHDREFAYRPASRLFGMFSLGFNDIIFGLPGDNWRSLRRLSTVHVFNSRKLDSTVYCREQDLRTMVSDIKSRPGACIDLRPTLGNYSINVMSMMLFSKQVESIRKLVELLDALTALVVNLNIGEIFPALDWLDIHGLYKNMREDFVPQLKSLLTQIFQQRREEIDGGAAENDSLLDALLVTEHGLSDTQMMALFIDLLAGGTETTGSTIEWCLAELINNPLSMQRVQTEADKVVGRDRLVQENDLPSLPFLAAVVKEVMRLHPVLPLGIAHVNQEESTLGGYKIPAKSQVVINLWAVGRDPVYWTDPDDFRPERFLESDVSPNGKHFQLIPFSSGRRICVGYPLALRTIPLVVGVLIHAFDWKPAGGRVDLEERPGTFTLRLRSELAASAQARLEESAYV